LPAGLNALRLLGIAVLVLTLIYGAFAGAAISRSFMKSRTREIELLNAVPVPVWWGPCSATWQASSSVRCLVARMSLA
jgi:hypothetical protein